MALHSVFNFMISLTLVQGSATGAQVKSGGGSSASRSRTLGTGGKSKTGRSGDGISGGIVVAVGRFFRCRLSRSMLGEAPSFGLSGRCARLQLATAPTRAAPPFAAADDAGGDGPTASTWARDHAGQLRAADQDNQIYRRASVSLRIHTPHITQVHGQVGRR